LQPAFAAIFDGDPAAALDERSSKQAITRGV
jgi:hypothetical protein